MKQKNKIQLPFKFIWPKKDEPIKPSLKTTKVLVSGILVTCIALSICSGFVDLVFFSGLSVSYYPLFGIFSMPAGVLFTLMSIGFIFAKFFCAMMLGAISELQVRLKNAGYTWYGNLNKAKFKWHAAHKFLIAVSLITSISLSVISIGTGLATKAGWLETISEYQTRAKDLISKYDAIGNTTLQSTFTKASQGSNIEKDADRIATEQTNHVWDAVSNWQSEYNTVTYNIQSRTPLDELDGESPYNYWIKKTGAVRTLLQQNDYTGDTSINALAGLSKSTIKTNIRTNIINAGNIDTNRSDIAIDALQDTKEKIVMQMAALLTELNNAKIEIPSTREKGKEPIHAVFDVEGDSYVQLQSALQQLAKIYKAWEADEGDTGSSSKIFTQISALLKIKKSSVVTVENTGEDPTIVSNMKTEEIMIMIVIMVFGIVQEFLIALFTPKSTIDRKMLSRFDACFESDFDIDKFLLSVYKDYLKKGVINQREFDAKARKCVQLMYDLDDNTIIEKFRNESLTDEKPQKPKRVKKQVVEKEGVVEKQEKTEEPIQPSLKEPELKDEGYSDKVDNLINEIEGMI